MPVIKKSSQEIPVVFNDMKKIKYWFDGLCVESVNFSDNLNQL